MLLEHGPQILVPALKVAEDLGKDLLDLGIRKKGDPIDDRADPGFIRGEERPGDDPTLITLEADMKTLYL